MDAEGFRRFGHELVDKIADYRASVATQPVRSKSEPGAIRARLPAEPPAEPEPFENVLRDFDEIVVPGLSHWQHPRFFGYFPCNGSLSSVLGDYVSTGLGVLGLAWQSSPALTEVEEVATDWLRRMLGLSDAWSGVIQDTASTSTLVALLCARERASAFSLAKGGLQDCDRPLVVYASEHAHSSVDKAALLAGFGRANLRKIGVDASYAMRADLLARAVAEDREAGRVPCAVVATTGTTTTTAFDPISAIAKVAREHGTWLHVDAAMAGSAMILPECRALWDGVEAADSLVVNPHKWLGVSFDCSAYYVRDPEHLVRVMSTSPSYLRTAVDEKVKNLRDWGIPLGRRFRALKLWFVIRHYGVEGLQHHIREHVRLAQEFSQWVKADDRFELIAEPPLNLVCFRLKGDDATNQKLLDSLNASGRMYLTHTKLDGRIVLRMSIGQTHTQDRHTEAAWAQIRACASSLAQQHSSHRNDD